jgi:hypothetical protein
MAVAAVEQQARKRDALTRRPQASRPEPLGDIVCLHGHSADNIWGSAVSCNATTGSVLKQK